MSTEHGLPAHLEQLGHQLLAAAYDLQASRTARQRRPIGAIKRARWIISNRVRHRLAVWSAVGAVSTGLSGGVIVAIIVLTSGASVAYAGWTATPTKPTTTAVTRSSGACNRIGDKSARHDNEFQGTKPSNVFTGTPVLTESRGIYTAVAADTNDHLYLCLTGGTASKPLAYASIRWFTSIPYKPGPQEISFPYGARETVSDGGGAHPLEQTAKLTPAQRAAAITRLIGGGYGQDVFGRAGRDVLGVSFSFVNGDTVTATVQNGRYFAWWPWLSAASSVTLTTTSGRITSHYYVSKRLAELAIGPPMRPLCKPGMKGCAYAPERAWVQH